jgi:hypothetical protein
VTTPTDRPSRERVPLRLVLADPGHSLPLDGAWWPQSRQLVSELAELVDHFPADRGRIVRATMSPPDWDDAPTRVPTARGYIQVGYYTRDDTKVVVLRTSDRQEFVLLVIPSSMSQTQGEEALRGALTPDYAASPMALLAAVAESHPADVVEESDDDDESEYEDTTPMYRSR